MKSLMASVMVLSMVGPVSAGLIVTLFPGANDFRIDNITNIDIDGSLYDAKFHHEISYDDLELLSVTPITFSSLPTAVSAGQATNAAIFSDGINSNTQTNMTLSYDIPFAADGVSVSARRQIRNGFNPLSYITGGGSAPLEDTALADNQAWVTYSLSAVPEPSSFILLLSMGAAGLIGHRRRKRKQTA